MKLPRKRQAPQGSRPSLRPIPAWRWTLVALAAFLAVSFGITLWLLAIAGSAKPGTDRANARLDAVRTGLAAGAGAGAAVGLILAFRRQHHQEVATNLTDFDASERRITELYTNAVEQLGSEKAPVRLGGLYALDRLAQDNPEHRQTIVNVVCAYLRMPFPPAAPGSRPVPETGEGTDAGEPAPSAEMSALPDSHENWQQERQVRLTAQRVLSGHLRSPDTHPAGDPARSRFWPGVRLDLTGATLIDFNLQLCVLATASFGGATFTGRALFDGAIFTSEASFDEATFTGDAHFYQATFASTAGFGGASFTGTAGFDGATFTGYAAFGNARFSGGALFSGATFSDAGFGGATFTSRARFQSARFTGGASFREATFTDSARFEKARFGRDAMFWGAGFGGETWFTGATFTGDATFLKATFTGDTLFNEVTFTGDAKFTETTFSGTVWYNEATFTGRAGFYGATFTGGAGFQKARFGGIAGFDGAAFSGGGKGGAFTGSRVLLPDAKHVWPAGWCIGQTGDGEHTVVPVDSDDRS